MGYYAKDGSYVRDDSDIEFAEAMNESQGQRFDRQQRVIAQAEAYENEQKRQKEAERDFNAQLRYEQREIERQQAIKRQQDNEQAMKLENEQKNMSRYGVKYDLRNPKDLNDRRARANFWRLNNNFRLLCDVVIGKNKRFGELWDQYSKAQTEEEREKIVEKMEKLYPTKESAIRSVEKKTGYRK